MPAMRQTRAAILLPLLAALVAVLWFDPRTPAYRSEYDPDALAEIVASWERDLVPWYLSPRYRRFEGEIAKASGRAGATTNWPAPDFAASYIFGKYAYRLDIQVRGENIHYISWGNDRQKDIGGAWFAVGEGKRRPDGRWFSIWSCLDLTRRISNGGGAWFEFSPDKKRMYVRYYHDTLPLGETALEEGEAVMLPPDGVYTGRPLEGRIQTYTPIVQAAQDASFVLWGRVVDENGAGVNGAAVKRRAAGQIEAQTDSRGFFKLALDRVEQLTLITAGKIGYYNGALTLDQKTVFAALGPSRGMAALATITLRTMDRTDHREYQFVSPHASPPRMPQQQLQCANCHTRAYDEWKASRHATMARNPWTRASFENDARPSALAAGRVVDDCTPCHSPSLAATLDNFDLNGRTLLDAHGVHLDGNHCDFCHKIEAVVAPQRPGMNGSIRLLRPDPKDDTFPGEIKRVFGPLPDVSFLYMGAGYNPLFKTGMLCAGCHEGVRADGFAGQGTYSEWSRTKYAKPGPDYRECQSCHMPAFEKGELRQESRPEGGEREIFTSGITRDEYDNNGMEIARSGTRYRPFNEVHRHTFVGSEDVNFMRTGVSMDVRAERTFGILRLRVRLENIGAGHAIPTGHGLKRLLLVVEGGDGQDARNPLMHAEQAGEAKFAHTGVILGRRFEGQTLEAVLEGSQGRIEGWEIPFWRATGEVRDDRLWPGKPRDFTFTLPDSRDYKVKLILRRASPELARAHGQLTTNDTIAGAPLDRVIHVWPAR